ncbi:hypothetical protein RW1_005_00900 [Rhodococcus wratislaviensis NBRC 100605]|uniref:Uncharacterized protein n=1 Tax=Rhodococcus wratislaviensis NBRC 100605 TaxID=1219028 RepID=X0QWN8_RHOWR|nr:hypothetical protein RW1_005_00900 [Rhodococcus wratislaviensis NBRC 100605]
MTEQSIDGRGVEERDLEGDAQMQPGLWSDGEGERVVGGVEGVGGGDVEAGGVGGGEGGGVEGVGLEDGEGVEGGGGAGGGVDVGEAEVVVVVEESVWVVWVRWRRSVRVSVGWRVMRTGMVLMNSPIIVSMPGRWGGRPETVVPKTTSLRWVWVDRTMPQAVWRMVLRVRFRSWARDRSASVSSSVSVSARSAEGPVRSRATSDGTSSVGSSMPSRAFFQAVRDWVLSWWVSQVR